MRIEPEVDRRHGPLQGDFTMSIFRASDLFTLHQVLAVEGKPDWMNLRTRRRPQWRGEPPALTGPGLYGMFYEDQLVYVGLYAGRRDHPFGGSVLDRWHKHAVYQTLRAPEVVFARSQLDRILRDLDGAAVADMRGLAGGGGLVEQHGGSCTFEKARFASRHWAQLGPGKDKDLLDRLSFAYHQLPRDWVRQVAPIEGQSASDWVKRQWLRRAEASLISAFAPTCNSGVEPTHGPPIDHQTFLDFAAALFAGDPAAPVACSPIDEMPAANDDMSPGERTFRTRLGEAGETLVEDLQRRCPSSMSIGFTDTPDLRIYLNQPRRVLVTLAPRASGKLSCVTLASVATCARLGLEAKAVEGVMHAQFVFDPLRNDVSDLLTIAGASVATLA